jgi:hypothetical protein
MAHSRFALASTGSFATTMRAMGKMPFARMVSRIARIRLADAGIVLSAPISFANGTLER